MRSAVYFEIHIGNERLQALGANNKRSPYIVQYFFARFVFVFPGFDPHKEVAERIEKRQQPSFNASVNAAILLAL